VRDAQALPELHAACPAERIGRETVQFVSNVFKRQRSR
jgi:hypothetical protein